MLETSQTNGSKGVAALIGLSLMVGACSQPPPAKVVEPAAAKTSNTGGALGLYRVVAPGRAGARAPTLLLTGTDADAADGVVAPDGNWFAYVSGEGAQSGIWIARKDGSGARQLSRIGGGYPVRRPAWSPDAKNLAYEGGVNEGSTIWIVPTAGGAPRELEASQPEARSPAWSHDGQWIYFERERAVWRVSADGGPAKAIRPGLEPRLSRDGRYLYYLDVSGKGIWRLTLEDGKTVRITASGKAGRWTLSETGVYLIEHGKLDVMKVEFEYSRTVPMLTLPDNAGMAKQSARTRILDISPDETWYLMQLALR